MPPENVKTVYKWLIVTLLLTLLELKHMNFRNMELVRNRPGTRPFHIMIFLCNSKYLLNTYYMPGLMLYTCLFSPLILTVIKHISLLFWFTDEKTRAHRDWWLAEDHTANKWQKQDWNLVCLIPESAFMLLHYSTTPICGLTQAVLPALELSLVVNPGPSPQPKVASCLKNGEWVLCEVLAESLTSSSYNAWHFPSLLSPGLLSVTLWNKEDCLIYVIDDCCFQSLDSIAFRLLRAPLWTHVCSVISFALKSRNMWVSGGFPSKN